MSTSEIILSRRELNKEVIRLTLPAIVSNITVPLLGMTDTAISGHLGSAVYIGAIAVGAMMMNVAFWLFGFLRMGTTGLTAQAHGAGDDARQRAVFSAAFLVAAAVGIAAVILQIPLGRLLLAFISPEPEIAAFASDYFSIVIWGAPPLLTTMVIQGWFVGMQTTRLPMIISIVVDVVNIGLSIVAVFPLGLGFKGIAAGTLAANWAGLILALVLAYRFSRGRLWASLAQIRRSGVVKRFFSVNADIFFRSACIMFVSMSVTAIGARLGELTLAVNAVMMQFFVMFSYFMDGFAFTGEALCGKFSGAGNKMMFHRSVRSLLWWSAGVALSFFLIYFFFGQNIVELLTPEREVVAGVMRHRVWLCLIPLLTVMAFIYDGFFIGLTATRRMLLATIGAAITFFAVCFIHISSFGIAISLPDNNTLWCAFLSYLLVRGGVLAIMSRSVFKLNTRYS